VEHPQDTAEDDEGERDGALLDAERLEFPLDELQSPGEVEIFAVWL
jgi:hypothetical protein